MIELHLIGPLGQHITIQCQDYADHLAKLREWGKRGFTSGDVPRGGYQFPYALFERFDWSLIGARKWTNPEGEDLILHRGMSYRIRQLDAVDSKKMQMPAAYKVSRGAKPFDPPEVIEDGGGEFKYVTLAVFRGGKGSVPDYELPTERPAQQRPPEQTPRDDVQPPTQSMKDSYLSLTKGTHWETNEGRSQLTAAVAKQMKLEGNFSYISDLLKLDRADVNRCILLTAEKWAKEAPGGRSPQ